MLHQSLQQVQLWSEETSTSLMNLSGIFNDSQGLFVSDAGDVYIDMGKYNGRVERWSPGAGGGQMVMNVSESCFSLFVDSNDTLYCSLDLMHQVVRTSLNSANIGASIVVAGNGTSGFGSNMLNSPRGIFVDASIGLHVADCGNNRVQLFQPGQIQWKHTGRQRIIRKYCSELPHRCHAGLQRLSVHSRSQQSSHCRIWARRFSLFDEMHGHRVARHLISCSIHGASASTDRATCW